MAVGNPGVRRLPCPCRARHAEQSPVAAHRRILQALAVAVLAALAVLGTSAAERFMLITVAVVAVAAFAVLQAIARLQRRRTAFADWRTWPPGYDPWAGRGDPVAGQHEGSAYRPGYGFLPGPGRGTVREG